MNERSQVTKDARFINLTGCTSKAWYCALHPEEAEVGEVDKAFGIFDKRCEPNHRMKASVRLERRKYSLKGAKKIKLTSQDRKFLTSLGVGWY